MASTADVKLVRTLIYGGSTRTGTLSSTDIGTLVDNAANVYLGAADAALAEAAVIAASPSRKVGDLSISYVGMEATFRQLAKDLRRRGIRSVKPFSGGISVADKKSQRSDSDYNQPSVKLGLHDNLDVSEIST